MVKLKDICDSVSITYNFSNVKEVVFLNTGDILEGKILVSSYSDVSFLPGQAKKSIQNGDILYSEIRPQNKRFCLVDVPNSQDYVVSTKLMVLRFKGKDFLPKFIYQYITQDNVVDTLQQLAESRSGTFPQITFSELGDIEIPNYSLDDQQHIVDSRRMMA
ncbi:MAG: restriction endonuclease subunit S [Firmicutes bacterium]|nr:restriction endonuclease subunit S [Bacillota bacterium]